MGFRRAMVSLSYVNAVFNMFKEAANMHLGMDIDGSEKASVAIASASSSFMGLGLMERAKRISS
jgi:hypothetical protein